MLALIVLLIGEVAGNSDQDRAGRKGRRTGRRKGRLRTKQAEGRTDSLETVERMNYGVSFSPIDGVYVPTEATYNLMLVMDVPMFGDPDAMWQECLTDPDGKCVDPDMCDMITPGIIARNRTSEQNQTCDMLHKFVDHLQKTRGRIAKGLLARLWAYVGASTAHLGLNDRKRQTRDVWGDNDDYTDLERGHDDSDMEENEGIPIAPFSICNTSHSFSERVACMAHSFRFQQMINAEQKQRNRHPRSSGHESDDLSEMLEDVVSGIEKVETQANQIDDIVQRMQVPHLRDKHPHSYRHKRAFFNLGGKILSSLFGTVTEEEASDMKHAIQALSSNQFKIAGRLQTFEKRVVAVANLTNDHLERMADLMKKVDTKFSSLIQGIHTGFMASSRFAALTASMMLGLMQNVERVTTEVDQFLVGLRALQRQELSVDLVNDNILREALDLLQDHIQQEYMTFSVAEKDPAYYYRYGKPTYSWDNGTLIIYLTVPLKSSNTAFKLYEVTGYSIPAASNESLVTRPVLDRDVFGIDYDKVNFLEMKHADFESCVMAKTIRCEFATVIRDVYHRSCLLALFENDREGIHKLCQYRLEAIQEEISLQPISPGRVLVSYAKTISMQCPGRPAMVRPGCKSCLVDQSCGCSLSATDENAKSVAITPSLTKCKDQNFEHKVEYPINIPALTYLMDPDKLVNLTHDAYVDSLDKIPLVTINVHPITNRLGAGRSHSLGMDLGAAVKQLKETSVWNPMDLEDIYERKSNNDWAKYLPASLGISLALGLLGTTIYVAHQKGWLKHRLRKRREASIETGDTSPDSTDEGDHNANPMTADLKEKVAAILHEFANEARQAGIIRPNTPTAPPTMYPNLHTAELPVTRL